MCRRYMMDISCIQQKYIIDTRCGAMEEKEKEPQQGYYRYYTQYPFMEKTYPDYYRAE